MLDHKIVSRVGRTATQSELTHDVASHRIMQVGIGDEITIIGSIADVETIAVGSSVRQMERLTKAYGPGRWRKRKGRARVRLPDGAVCQAELHWYEAHGVGRREMKIKRILRFE